MSQEENKSCDCCCETGAAKEATPNFFKRHKKLSWTLGIILGILIILRLSLGLIVQTAVTNIAPAITGVPVSIGDVSINLFSGYVALEEIKVGNPAGYDTENMLSLKKAVFDLDVTSLFSEKIRIEEITVTGLDLYYVQKLNSNNISDLQANVEKNLGIKKEAAAEKKDEAAPEEEEEPAEAKKLQVDKIQMNDITAHVVVAGVDVPIMMIPINMENLGTGPEGITAGGIFAAILNKLSLGASDAAIEAVKKSGAAAGKALKDLGNQTGEALKDAGKNLKNIFKRK